jgi:hypothetical protein
MSWHKRLVQRWLSDLNNPLSLGHLQPSLHDARLIADLNNPLSLGHLQTSLHDARLIADLSIFFTVYFMVV